MSVATEPYFRGRWLIEREIEHLRDGSRARFTGEAVFTAAETPGLICRESGVLEYGGGSFAAERVTLWQFGGDGSVEVRYADGSPFHVFSADAPKALHLCGADRYEVAYELAAGGWASRWRVTGPAKDYVMETVYRRPPG